MREGKIVTVEVKEQTLLMTFNLRIQNSCFFLADSFSIQFSFIFIWIYQDFWFLPLLFHSISSQHMNKSVQQSISSKTMWKTLIRFLLLFLWPISYLIKDRIFALFFIAIDQMDTVSVNTKIVLCVGVFSDLQPSKSSYHRHTLAIWTKIWRIVLYFEIVSHFQPEKESRGRKSFLLFFRIMMIKCVAGIKCVLNE